MRFVLLAAILASTFIGHANNYYFSTSAGDDNRTAAQAQNPATPWKSIGKLNAFFPELLPGDSVLFKRGDVFEGRILATKSGTDARNLVITAYGDGPKPVISGLRTLANLSPEGGNIWSQWLNTGQPAILLLNDRLQPLGRYPNASDANGGYLTIDSHNGKNSITDNLLGSGTNWTGAEVVIRKKRWVLDRGTVTGQSGNTLYYDAPSNYEPINGFGYFLQNHVKALDKNGEWAYDNNRNKVYLFSDTYSPANNKVQVSVVDTLMGIRFQNNITIRDLQFKGANENAISLYSTRNITIDACDFSFAGLNAIYLTAATGIDITNSTFSNLNNNAITTYYGCGDLLIKGNTFTNTGVNPGMGKTGDLSYQAITVKGKNISIQYNRIDNTGYVPIRFEGDNITVQNNFITNFLFVKDDGGGIYTWNNDYGAGDNSNRLIKDNVILNAIGAGEGTNKPGESAAHGIYLDDNAANVEITGNTVAGSTLSGLYIHNAHNVSIKNNTLFDNARQVFMQDDNVSVNPVRNANMRGNILFSKSTDQQLMFLRSFQDDLEDFGSSDNNFFVSPFNPKPSIYTMYVRSPGELIHAYDLASWQGAFKKDGNSKGEPAQIAPYQNNGLVGSNKLTNTTFDNNIYGVYGFVSSGTYKLEQSNAGKLDGGALQVTMTEGANNRGFAIMNIGNVVAGKTYLLKFSLLGSSNHKSISMYLRKAGSPYTKISAVNFCKVLTSRTENEILFTPTTTEASAAIVFDISDQNTLWLDNMGLYEVNTSITDPENFVRFEYNATSSSKTVALDGNYLDATGKSVAGSVTLAPYSSVVLLRTKATAKKNQTIAFDQPDDKAFGSAPLALSAKASSGLPVSFAVLSGPATVSDNMLTITGVGTVTLEASQQGDAVYNAAPAVKQTMKIAKGEQAILFPAIGNKSLDDDPFMPGASSTAGLPITYRLVSGPGQIKNGAITVTGIGTVVVEAAQKGNDKYNAAASVQQSFAVMPGSARANQVISFPAVPTKMYGEAPFALDASSSSGLPVSYRIVSGPGSVSGNLLTLTVAGRVTIEASQDGSNAFNAANPVLRTFDVIKANQAITFDDLADIEYTDDPISLTATAESTLPVTYRIVSGPATVEGSDLTLTGPGKITVEASQPGNENYNAAATVRRSFTVTATSPDDSKKEQSISFGSLGYKLYNSAPFNLNAKASSHLPVTFRILAGPASLDGNTVTVNGIGMVDVEASQPGNDKYHPAKTVVRTFEVGRAGQVINFPNIANKSVGDAPFALNATASSGKPVSYKVISGPAAVNGNVVSILGAGRVSIEASQDGDAYYFPAFSPVRIFTVKADNSFGSSDTDPVGVLVVEGGSAKQKTAVVIETAKAGMKVFPNPLIHQGVVSISVPESVMGTLAIYDAHGRMVKSFGNRRFEKGQLATINISAHGLSSGTYILRLVTAGKNGMTQKFVVMR